MVDRTESTAIFLRIGEVATRTGVSVQALRHYERKGLIEPKRSERSRYRLYLPSVLEEVLFIRHAQEVGFSLDEIRELLQIRQRSKVSGYAPPDEAREAVGLKLEQVEERIERLVA